MKKHAIALALALIASTAMANDMKPGTGPAVRDGSYETQVDEVTRLEATPSGAVVLDGSGAPVRTHADPSECESCYAGGA